MGIFTGISMWIKRIFSIGKMMKDREVSLWKKALVVFAVIYLFIPIEIIPDFLFPIGFADDIILWVCVLLLLKDTLSKYVSEGISKDAKKKYKGKTVIDDVQFEVKEDDGDR